jgi:hypothetical protein
MKALEMLKYIFGLFLIALSMHGHTKGEGYVGVDKGQYADLLIFKHGDYDGVKLHNKRKWVIVCHWGIDGQQYVSYLSPNTKSDQLYYDNKHYRYYNVSWSCQRDYKLKHKVGTFLKYSNKYIQ